jgi:hypothetical protein
VSDPHASSFAAWLTHPFALAVLLTLLNAGKPVVVDDTAYLLIARHIAEHPTDPYGHLLFWYEKPEPAMTILAPPIVPYWLALGIRLFGEDTLVLKCWLLPFAWLLTHSARALVRRFVHPSATWPIPLLTLGPGVLPFFNFMLDVPTLALELTTIHLALRATDAGSAFRWRILAGVLGGMALQTKYSMLFLPLIVLLIGWRRQQLRRVGLTILLIPLVFSLMECACCYTQGQSHFLYHLAKKAQNNGETFADRVVERFCEWCGLFHPLLAFSGVLSAPVAFLCLVFLGLPKRWVLGLTLFACLGWLIVLFVPGHSTVLVRGEHPARDRTTLATVHFITLGTLATLAGLWAAWVGVIRHATIRRRSPLAEILFGWFMLEIIAYFALSPFPAARRLIGVAWVVALIAYRLAHRTSPIWCRAWTLRVGLTISIVVMAIDCWDAAVEPWVARRAAALARTHASGRGFGVGHWGFQYALDREGATLITPNETQLRVDDWLILPLYPDDVGFYRPYHGEANIVLDESAVERLGEIVWDDWLAAQTVPALYGGKMSIVSRKHPRLRVGVYRVTRDWTPRLME